MSEIILADGGYKVYLPGSAELKKGELLTAANAAPAIKDAATQAIAFKALSDMKSWIKAVEIARQEVKKPVLEATRTIDRLAAEYILPLTQACTGLEMLLSRYHDEEKKRIEEDQKLKDEEIALQKQIEEEAAWEAKQAAKMLESEDASEEDLQRAVDAEADAKMAAKRTELALRNPVITTPTRQAGMVVRDVVKWEITDAKALYAAAPHFFRLEPNRAVITGSVTKDTVLPGLKVTTGTKVGARV